MRVCPVKTGLDNFRTLHPETHQIYALQSVMPYRINLDLRAEKYLNIHHYEPYVVSIEKDH